MLYILLGFFSHLLVNIDQDQMKLVLVNITKQISIEEIKYSYSQLKVKTLHSVLLRASKKICNE